MFKRGTSRHTLHPTLRALGVAAMRRGGRLDVQEHTRNAHSRRLTSSSPLSIGSMSNPLEEELLCETDAILF